MKPQPWILIIGFPTTGFVFYGPFPTKHEAQAFSPDGNLPLCTVSMVVQLVKAESTQPAPA